MIAAKHELQNGGGGGGRGGGIEEWKGRSRTRKEQVILKLCHLGLQLVYGQRYSADII